MRDNYNKVSEKGKLGEPAGSAFTAPLLDSFSPNPFAHSSNPLYNASFEAIIV